MELSMKGWSYYLLRVWRWIRIPVIVVALLAMLLYSLMLYLANDCDYQNQTISPKMGDFDAIVEEKWCGFIGSWCEETIRLHRRTGWSLDTKIFIYTPTSAYERPERPWTHSPVVVWSSANELDITVDRVDRIYSQLKEACGVKITYRIGFVNSQFEDSLGLEGEKIIGLLKTKIMDTQDDWTVDDCVLVLKDMVRRETYDVVGDEELMRLVDERVKAMKDPRIKEMTEKDVDTIREWSTRERWLSVENVKRREMFSLLRSEGFYGSLDIFTDFWPIGEIEVGAARLKLVVYVDNDTHPGWEGRQFKELLIFSQSHYLGSYPIDQFPTGIRGNTLEFPGGSEEGNSIVFDSELPPKKIYLGGKVRNLDK
jgi:hypothetical protein